MLKLCLLLIATIQIALSWQNTTVLHSFTQQTGLSNLYDFSAQVYQNGVVLNLIIFGGYTISNTNQTIFLNNIYKINLNDPNYSAVEIGQTSVLIPSARNGSSSLIYKDGFYIQSGQLKNGTLTDQLWVFNITNSEWTLLANTIVFSTCNIMILNNSTLTGIGIQSVTNKLLAFQYYPTNNTFTAYDLIVLNAIQFSFTLWDGTNQTTYLKVTEMRTGFQNYNFTVVQNYSLNIFEMCSFISQGVIVTITNIGTFYGYKSGSNYYLRYLYYYSSQKNQRIKCSITGSQLLFFKGQIFTQTPMTFSLNFNFYSIITSTFEQINYLTPNFQSSWIPEFTDFNTFILNQQQIYVILGDTLQTYRLKRNCIDSIYSSPNIQSCIYGNYICKQSYSSQFCQNKECPGSLSIVDLNNIVFTVIQCSGNGKCTSSGCKCNELWGGDDCSFYQRTSCQGALQQNFPVANCECLNNPYAGGNYCQVVFCYNDCTGHGTCNSLGVCQCNSGYRGPDCSILLINFEFV